METWAYFMLTKTSEAKVKEALLSLGVKEGSIASNMHVTLYWAPIKLDSTVDLEEPVDLQLDVKHTRFMLMKKGGQVPIPEEQGGAPSKNKIGLRIQNASEFRNFWIKKYRKRLLDFEEATEGLTGRPSNRCYNRFGYPNYVPHLTILNPDNDAPYDLYPMAAKFRELLGVLSFDRFGIQVRKEPELENFEISRQLGNLHL